MIDNTIVPGFMDDNDNSLVINLEKSKSVQGGIIVILSGYIDTYNTAYLKKQMEKIVGANFYKIIFACHDVKYVSSTGLGALCEIQNLVKSNGGDIVFANSQKRFVEIFHLLGLYDNFTFKESVESAENVFIPEGERRSLPSHEQESSPAPSAGDVHSAPAHAPAPAAVSFPVVITCPSCSNRLNAPKSGKFRCPGCKSIIFVDACAKVSLV